VTQRCAALVAALALGTTPSCDSASETLLPPSGTLLLAVRDSGLVLQGAQPPGFQVVQWTITEATADIEGRAEPFDFLRREPCVFTDNVLLIDSFYGTCGDGLVLDPTEGTLQVTLHLTIRAVEARRGIQPDLQANEDFDGDGHLNRYDNCPMVVNEDQLDENEDRIGDVCDLEFQDVFFLDTDVDGVPDVSDNCSRVPNPPASPDPDNPFVPGVDLRGGADLIGDACEDFLRPSFPDRPQDLELTYSATVLISDRARSTLLVDFNSRDSLVCNATLTDCKVAPGAITLTVL
jgi:hypothetical protein